MRIKELEAEIKELKEQRQPFEVAERIRDKWKIMFGWPRISQELSLAKKLDKETYEKLYREVEKVIDEVARMVEDPPKPEKLNTWQKFKSMFQ